MLGIVLGTRDIAEIKINKKSCPGALHSRRKRSPQKKKKWKRKMCTSFISSNLTRAAWFIVFSSQFSHSALQLFQTVSPHSSQNLPLLQTFIFLYSCFLQQFPCGRPTDNSNSLCSEPSSASFFLGRPFLLQSCSWKMASSHTYCSGRQPAVICGWSFSHTPDSCPFSHSLTSVSYFGVLNPFYIHPVFPFCTYHDSLTTPLASYSHIITVAS